MSHNDIQQKLFDVTYFTKVHTAHCPTENGTLDTGMTHMQRHSGCCSHQRGQYQFYLMRIVFFCFPIRLHILCDNRDRWEMTTQERIVNQHTQMEMQSKRVCVF